MTKHKLIDNIYSLLIDCDITTIKAIYKALTQIIERNSQ